MTTVLDDHREAMATPAKRWRWSAYRTGVLLVVVASTALRLVTMSSWTFFQDDWLYLSRTNDQSVLGYSFQVYNSHLMPGQFLIVEAVTAIAPLSYGWAIGVTCVLAVVALLAWALALREIFGERPHLLILPVLLGLSPIFTTQDLWWSSALQVYPLLAAMGFAVLLVTRYLRHGRRRDQVWLTATYLVGLFFWEKMVIVLVPLAFMSLLLLDVPRREAVRRGVSALWPLIAATVVYLPLYLVAAARAAPSAGGGSPQVRSLGQVADFYLHGVVDVALPSMLGGPFSTVASPYAAYAAVPRPVAVALVLLALGASVVALRTRRRAGAAIGLALAYAVVSWGLVLTSTRFDWVGTDSVRAGRYVADILVVALLALLFVFTPLVDEPVERALRQPVSAVSRARVGRAARVMVAVVATVAVVCSVRNWQRIETSSGKTWVAAITADARAAGSATVLDAATPENVFHPIYFYGDASLSRVLAPMGLPVRFDTPTNQFLVATPSGHLRRGEIVAPAATNVTPSPVPDCGYRVEPGSPAVIPLTADLYDYRWIVQVDYVSGEASRLTIRSDSRAQTVPVASGLNRVLLVDVDAISGLVVEVPDGAPPLCVTQVKIGGLQAVAGPIDQ